MQRNEAWANQTQLAKALGITTRRVRQLVDARILPDGRDGKWHLPTCGERYRIFLQKTERDIDKVAYDVEQRATQLEDLLDELVDAENDEHRRDLLPKAVDLHREMFEALAFMISAWSKSESERALMLRLIDYDAREAFAPIWRAMQIIVGNERGCDPDLVHRAEAG